MVTRTCISLVEEAELALDAARQRLERARRAVKDFASLHHGSGMPSDLDVELDEAIRNCAKAERDLRELQS